MSNSKNLAGLTLGEFVRVLASDAPAPGGGSVAALAGALGASLCAMVARLTVGRPKYRDSRESMERLRDEADELSRVLLGLVDKDLRFVYACHRGPQTSEGNRCAKAIPPGGYRKCHPAGCRRSHGRLLRL